MDRQKVIEQAYQKGNTLNLNNQNYRNWIKNFFETEFSADLGSGDKTSNAVLQNNRSISAIIKSKESGVIGGIEEINWFYNSHELGVKAYSKDGEEIRKGEPILEIHGGQKNILATERIGLNILQRMSGIASETSRLNELIKEFPTKIAATRKSPLRYLDKKAVFLGKGLTHRFGLWDSILIKDNHLEILKNKGIKEYIEIALMRVKNFSNLVNFIEIEVTTIKDAIRAATKFRTLGLKQPCIIMLDNMIPKKIKKVIENLRQKNLYDFVILEASGVINPTNIIDYAKTGIDVISLGYLTHSMKVLDISLEIGY